MLTFLPFAIFQAAAYINENDTSVQVYLELLDDTEENVIDLLSGDPSAKNPVASTRLVSFEQISCHHPLAEEYLSCMSCLHDNNIPVSAARCPFEEEDGRCDWNPHRICVYTEAR